MENSRALLPVSSLVVQKSPESLKLQLPKSNQEPQVGTVSLYGVRIVTLVIERQERLCLAQISNSLLKKFTYNEIHNRRVALGITCVQCTPVQLEILRRAGAMPPSSRRCGMITRREAERLCKSFLSDNTPPRLPEDFAFLVHHEINYGCRGAFIPSRYNSSRAKCIKCTICGLFFSPNKFIFHFHETSPLKECIRPDGANFNSWRRHMKLSGDPPDEIVYAWEDVKAMFNGGTRKRILSNNTSSDSSISQTKRAKITPANETTLAIEQNSISGSAPTSPVAQQRIPPFSDLAIPLPGDHVIDYIWHQHNVAVVAAKAPTFPMLSYMPWFAKRNSILFPSPIPPVVNSSIEPISPPVSNNLRQSAFHPVIRTPSYAEGTEPLPSEATSEQGTSYKEDNTDDEVDVETMQDDVATPVIKNISNSSPTQSHTVLNTQTVHSTTSSYWSPPRETEREAEKCTEEAPFTTDIKSELVQSRNSESWCGSPFYRQLNLLKGPSHVNNADIDCTACRPGGFLYGLVHSPSKSVN